MATLHPIPRRPLAGALHARAPWAGSMSVHTRCPRARERCRVELPLLREVDGRQVACHFADEP